MIVYLARAGVIWCHLSDKNRIVLTYLGADAGAVSLSFTLIFVGAIIAVLMVSCEFKVIQLTDALSLMVAGSFKELLTVACGVAIFGDTFTTLNLVGICVLLAGVLLFNVLKYRKAVKMKEEARRSSGFVELRSVADEPPSIA